MRILTHLSFLEIYFTKINKDIRISMITATLLLRGKYGQEIHFVPYNYKWDVFKLTEAKYGEREVMLKIGK